MKSILFVFLFLISAVAFGEDFFTQEDLHRNFERELDSDTLSFKYRVGDNVYADRNGDGKYSSYRIQAIMPNGDYLAQERGFSTTHRFSENELVSGISRLVGKNIYGDKNGDGVFAEYKVVGRKGRMVLATDLAYNSVVSFNMREIAFRTHDIQSVFLDRNGDGKFTSYVISGIFGNGDVIVHESISTKYYRASVREIAFPHHWLVGQKVFGDSNGDGNYVQYTISGILPGGKVVARDISYTNYLSFSPDDLGYTSAQTAYDVYIMMCQHIKLYRAF